MSVWEDLRRRFEHAVEIAAEEPQRALRVLDGLLRLAPENYMIRFNAAMLLSRLGRYDAALDYFAQAVDASSGAHRADMEEAFWAAQPERIRHRHGPKPPPASKAPAPPVRDPGARSREIPVSRSR